VRSARRLPHLTRHPVRSAARERCAADTGSQAACCPSCPRVGEAATNATRARPRDVVFVQTRLAPFSTTSPRYSPPRTRTSTSRHRRVSRRLCPPAAAHSSREQRLLGAIRWRGRLAWPVARRAPESTLGIVSRETDGRPPTVAAAGVIRQQRQFTLTRCAQARRRSCRSCSAGRRRRRRSRSAGPSPGRAAPGRAC
jgi:hypothetical protein